MIDRVLLVTPEGLERIQRELGEYKHLFLSQIVQGVGDYLQIAQQFDCDWHPTGNFWVMLTREQRKYLSRQVEQSSYTAAFKIVKSR